MKKQSQHALWLITVIFLISACFSPKSPQEVSNIFWESVIHNDVNRVVKYSTLVDPQQYDAFSNDWNGLLADSGKVVIDGNEASIQTTISNPVTSPADDKEFLTYLILRNGDWVVDYARTKQDLNGDLLQNLFGQLNQIGDSLSEKLIESSHDFSAEMSRMGKQLEELSLTIGQQTSESINRYSEGLRKNIDDFADSLERALKEKQKQMSEDDKRIITQVLNDLNKESDKLSDPSIQSIADGSESIAKAQVQLQSIDKEISSQYSDQWQQWGKNFEIEMQKIIEEISRSADSEKQHKKI